MKSLTRWLYLISALVTVFVVVSSVAAAIREGSWTPIEAVGWIPAVIIACLPAARHRCRPSRRANRPV